MDEIEFYKFIGKFVRILCKDDEKHKVIFGHILSVSDKELFIESTNELMHKVKLSDIIGCFPNKDVF